MTDRRSSSSQTHLDNGDVGDGAVSEALDRDVEFVGVEADRDVELEARRDDFARGRDMAGLEGDEADCGVDHDVGRWCLGDAIDRDEDSAGNRLVDATRPRRKRAAVSFGQLEAER